jgi:4-hydroxybenzoate polyprenyltransferase
MSGIISSPSDIPRGGWVDRLVPAPARPYARLMRLDRPIGTWLLLFPCWWSLALAWGGWRDAWLFILFGLGAMVMRGAGCTYNDIVDEGIDNQVERTRSRPLPAGHITVKQALAFLVALALVGFVVLLQFNRFAVMTGIASLLVVAIYPFMKRVTWWPQVFLGLAFSWGALMGWAVEFGDLDGPAIMLYIGSILWVIGYDTIYAHQDKEDDAIVGVRSTARLFGDNTKMWLTGLYGGALICFAIAFASAQMPIVALAGLIAAGAHMARQIIRLDINNPDQCLKLFKSNNQVGWLIFLGLIGGSLWVALKPLI